MARDQESKAEVFFMATLVMWAVSVLFEIGFNNRAELLPIIGGFLFFQSANWVIRNYLSRGPLFVNTCVSLLHSSITSAAVVIIVLNRWMTSSTKDMFEHSQLVEATWPGAYAALCISSGYFAYDQWDMLLYRLYSGPIPSILVHHLLLLICFTLALYRNVTINYLILTLICEVKFFIILGSSLLGMKFFVNLPLMLSSSFAFLKYSARKISQAGTCG